jgi:hypothetical protein
MVRTSAVAAMHAFHGFGLVVLVARPPGGGPRLPGFGGKGIDMGNLRVVRWGARSKQVEQCSLTVRR